MVIEHKEKVVVLLREKNIIMARVEYRKNMGFLYEFKVGFCCV